MAQSWRDIRAETDLDEARVLSHRIALTNDQIAARLAKARHLLGMSAEEVETELAFEPGWVAALESSGIGEVPLMVVQAYAGFLGGHLWVQLPDVEPNPSPGGAN